MPIQYNQQLSGQLSIVTIPSGAEIHIDGIIQQDKTTPAIIELPSGMHIYRLSHPGYINEDGMTIIEDGNTQNLFITMHESFNTRDVVVYGFVASTLAGIVLYSITRRKTGHIYS